MQFVLQKLATKNVALLHYPLDLTSDPTSALASSTFTTTDIDSMGEYFGGELSTAQSVDTGPPCVTIMQGPGRKQSWRLDCPENPPADRHIETFQTYTNPNVPTFVMSRTEFTFDGEGAEPFVRKYRPQDDMSRAFGIGASDSFDIFLTGDSQTFATIELVMADGALAEYRRTSSGQSYVGANWKLTRTWEAFSAIPCSHGMVTAGIYAGWTVGRIGFRGAVPVGHGSGGL